MDSSGDESRCSVGNFLNLQCRKKECVTFDSLSDENKELLQWRTGLNSFLPDSKLCQTHYNAYIKWYANNQKVCFDPNSQHKTRITKCLRKVTIGVAKQLKTKLNVNVAPGMKYCDSCRKSLQQNLNEVDQRNENAKSAQDSSDPDSQNWSQASNYSNTDSQVCKDQIADIFNQLNLDRINFDGTRSESKALCVWMLFWKGSNLLFFATSHGKSPCDGVGGTINERQKNDNLRRPYDEQILSVEKLLEFCKQRIRNIQCEIVWKKNVDALRHKETVKAFTIPGTRNFHEFVPLNNQIVKCKKVSTDPEYCLAFDLINKKKV